MGSLKDTDIDVFNHIESEQNRQNSQLELIASENIVSAAVLEAQGSIFTNKYAEGYPGKRYYGGCEYTDEVETLAIERAKKVFDCEYANVQPHSGSGANMAVYFATLKPGDKVLGMDLAHGGHLTHGSQVSFSGQLFNFISYGVDKKTETINMEEVERIAFENRPKMIVAGASAYSRHIDFEGFRKIADQIGAMFMVDMAHIAGLVAAGVHPSPIPYADFVTTTTHKTLRGPRGGLILAKEKWGKSIDSKIFPGIQGGPLMHVIAAKAVAFKEAMAESFQTYQKDVVENSKVLASHLTKYGIKLVSGGTDNHLMIVDLRNLNITGNIATDVLGSAGITVNKNSIPFEKLSPTVTSGIRIRTPAMTTRGFNEEDAKALANWMCDIVDSMEGETADETVVTRVREQVRDICARLPVYA